MSENNHAIGFASAYDLTDFSDREVDSQTLKVWPRANQLRDPVGLYLRCDRTWQPFSTVPRDGSLLDLFSDHGTGRRSLNVRFVKAVEVDPQYGPGQPLAHLAQDGFRYDPTRSEVLCEANFTHWRYVGDDRPAPRNPMPAGSN